MKRFLLLGLACVTIALVVGCGSGSGSGSSARLQGVGTGTLNLLLTDCPAEYDHVYVDVREVWIHGCTDTIPDTPDSTRALLATSGGRGGDHGDDDDRGHGDDDGGKHGDRDDDDHGDRDRDHDGDCDECGTWIQLEVTPMIVDLLTLQNGVFMGLATQEVPAGKYDAIRLVLGDQNSIVVDSVTYALKVPSGQTSGFKLKGEFEVPAGGSVDVGIDFDASRSIVHTGNGKYILKPCARIYPIATTGSIAGRVAPGDFQSHVFAIVAPDTVASALTDSEGRFTIALLPGGTYSVSVVPTTDAYNDTTLTGVLVTPGQTTSLGVIPLSPVPPPPVAMR